LKKRADDIPEPALRARYLTNVAVNVRVAVLARAWLGEDAGDSTLGPGPGDG
jgi:hypothetical protein